MIPTLLFIGLFLGVTVHDRASLKHFGLVSTVLSLAWMVLIAINAQDSGADTIHLGPLNVAADGAAGQVALAAGAVVTGLANVLVGGVVGFAVGAPLWYLTARHRKSRPRSGMS